jgi:hypothetical protein
MEKLSDTQKAVLRLIEINKELSKIASTLAEQNQKSKKVKPVKFAFSEKQS